MSLNNINSLNSSFQGKYNQLKTVLAVLKQKPMTMKEIDLSTGIMRENVCRYIDMLLDTGEIALIRKRKCSVTGYPFVNEYTGNKELFPKSNQLKLF